MVLCIQMYSRFSVICCVLKCGFIKILNILAYFLGFAYNVLNFMLIVKGG